MSISSPPATPSNASAWRRWFRQAWYRQQLNRLTYFWQALTSRRGRRAHFRRAAQAIARATAVALFAAGSWSAWMGGPPSAVAAPLVPAVPVTVTTTADELNTGGACSLREAIQLANGDLTERGCGTTAATSISVPSGTITLALTGAENDGFGSTGFDNAVNDLDILSGTSLTITGQGAGTTIIQAGTTADDGTGTMGNGIDRVFHVLGDLDLSDVTVRHGLVSGGGTGTGLGGGIAVRDGTLTVTDSVITGNTAVDTGTNPYDGYGGGINNANGTVTLNNTQVSDNNATDGGGGVGNWAVGNGNIAELSVTGGLISNNAAREGGGIQEISYMQGTGTIIIDGTTIDNNSASTFGGGVRLVPHDASGAGATGTITNATITNNSAGSGGGGGINGSGSGVDLTVEDSTINDNTATSGGGSGIRFNGNMLTVRTSTISGNHTTGTGDGGGLNAIGDITVADSLISGNSALYGGGIAAAGAATTIDITDTTISGNNNTSTSYGTGGVYIGNSAAATLTNTTITGNTTAGSGVGNGVYLYNGGTADLKNSIVTNNQNGECFGTLTGNNNLVDDGTCAGSLGTVTNFDTSLDDNGGPTLTHAIGLSSNAIDTGNATDCTAADQRGVSRPQDGDMDNTAVCDIGAVEAVPNVCSISTGPNYTFGGVVINLSALGSSGLDCLRVEFVDGDHPDATSSPSNMALETGRYWRINGFESDGVTPVTDGFTADVTLPFAGADADTRACKWLDGTGGGFGWDCGTDTDNTEGAGTVTRDNYTGGFSDWAVGNPVGPTAVDLQSTTADAETSPVGLVGWLTAMLAALSGWAWFSSGRRRS